MAELVVGIDTSEKLPEGYTRLEYLRSVNGAQWIVDSTLTTMTSGSYEIKVSNLTSLCRFVGFCGGSETTSGDAYTTQCCIATPNYVSNPTSTYFPINYQNNDWNDDSTNTVNIVQENILKYEFRQGEQKLYVNGVLNKQGNVTTIPSGSYPFRLFRVGNSVYPVSFTGSSSIHYCKVYNANGELIRNYIPCKNSSNVYGMYELVTGSFFVNRGSGTFTAGPEYTPNIQYARVPALVVEKGAPIKKYNLYDRITDDNNVDIGIVTGFFTKNVEGHDLPSEYTEYAIVCLNAQYRIENNNSNAIYCTSTVSNQKYYTTIEDVWNTTDTATEINDALYTEKSTDAVAINYLRTNFSFTIEGNVYKPQVPNIPELYSILNNFTIINNSDPTASSYPAKTLKTGTQLGAVPPSFPESQDGYRSCQFVNNWQTISCWACGIIGNQGISHIDGPSSGSNVYAFVVPVLELPNQIMA